MFKHKNGVSPLAEPASSPDLSATEPALEPKSYSAEPSIKGPAGLRELMEKNLKWSQIIYEQNRKINSKLLWSAVANWTRTIIIAVPIILVLWFLPSAFSKFKESYAPFLDSVPRAGVGASTGNIQELLKNLPLGDAERQQLLKIIK